MHFNSKLLQVPVKQCLCFLEIFQPSSTCHAISQRNQKVMLPNILHVVCLRLVCVQRARQCVKNKFEFIYLSRHTAITSAFLRS